MDAAARGIKPIALHLLDLLRTRREEEAHHAVRAKAAALQKAEAEVVRSSEEYVARERERSTMESAIRAQFSGGTPITLAVLAEARLRIAGLSEQVEAARIARGRCEDAAVAANSALEQARMTHSARMCETKRWAKAHDRIKFARRVAAEGAEASAIEDEISDRLRARAFLP